MTFLKNHPSLVPSQPPFSHAAVEAQKRMHDRSKFSFHPLNFLTASHTVLSSPLSLSPSIDQQAVHVRTNSVNLNWFKLVAKRHSCPCA
jgi:hypothetical protein